MKLQHAAISQPLLDQKREEDMVDPRLGRKLSLVMRDGLAIFYMLPN